ncbi:MAG: FAD-binding oxidoreductase [Sulfurifustaceae bacterium]
MDDLIRRLRSALGDDAVLDAHDVARRSAGVRRKDTLKAALLVRPRDTQEVSTTMRLCHQANVAVVPQGGLTGLVRGADAAPTEVILSLERMRGIEAIDPLSRTVTVQAGVTLQALQEAIEPHQLAFPLDLSARGSCTIGGNVATNAGGNRVIRHGMMRDMVLGLEVVLADGTVIDARNRLIKNNAGYDIKQLFIGSEGTLGIVTRAVLRLSEKPVSQQVALLAVASFEKLALLLKHMHRALGGSLSAFEVMWPEFYEVVTTAPARSRPPLARGHGYYVLVEGQGGDPDADDARFEATLVRAGSDELIIDAVLARSQAERDALWAIREDTGQLRRFEPISVFDVSLPIPAMPAYVDGVRRALTTRGENARCFVFGHLGDGNLHVVVAGAGGDRDAVAQVERIVYGPLAEIGGSISAEHGIGLEKKAHLGISRSSEEIALMRRLKHALDPHGILNPGKVIDV